MPFLDNPSGPDDAPSGLLLGPINALREQPERLVALNIAWALVLAPGLAGLVIPGLPVGMRVGLMMLSSVLFPPATATLFALCRAVDQGELLDLPLARQALQRTAAGSYRCLAPLYGLLTALLLLCLVSAQGGSALAAVPQLALLLTLTCATYWGPLIAEDPSLSPGRVLAVSAWLLWERPGRTLAACAVQAVILAIAAVSVGGLVLIGAMLAGLVQTRLRQETAVVVGHAPSAY